MQFSRDLAREAFKSIMDKLRPPHNQSTFNRRSRSTGDLYDPQYELIEPGPCNGTGDIAPGEDLPAHPDDRDRIPVEFIYGRGMKDEPVMRILNPHSATAKEMTRSGDDIVVPSDMIHITQRWFYPDMRRGKAESILMRLGLIDGSFLVREFNGHLALSLTFDQRVCHFLILTFIDGKNTRFFIESDHSFVCLPSLISYYRTHGSSLLPCKLQGAACRAPYYRRSSEEVKKAIRIKMNEKNEEEKKQRIKLLQ